MNVLRRFRAVSGLFLAAWLAAGVAQTTFVPSVAHAEVIERVVAVVNDEAIFLSEVRRRSAPFLPQVMQAGTEMERVQRLGELYRQVLDHLIDDALFQQAGRRLQIRVSTDDVDRAIANVRQQSHLDEPQFWAAVREQGFTEAQYRQDVKRQLLRLKVLNQRVRGRVNITEREVRERYDQTVRQARASLRFHAAHVFFALPQNPTATDVARVRAQAQAVRDTLTPDNFLAAAAEHGGGDLGELRQEDLPESLGTALASMEQDEISQPVRGPQGFHVLLLSSRELGDAQIPDWDEARQLIYRQMLEAAMQRQETLFLDELRHDADIDRRL